jgi:hypothetical protein
MPWVINDWYREGERVETIAPEGSFKTIWDCYKAVCISSGEDCLGHKVKQGAVVIVDNETPRSSLTNHLNRFSQYFQYKGYDELPIHIYPSRNFVLDRKGELDKLLAFIERSSPVYIGLDSLLSMLPLGRQGVTENSSILGGILGRDLLDILDKAPGSVTDLAVHTKKRVSEYSIGQLRTSDVQSLVRGHGSIVGEGSDTCVILKKISEHPKPTRFAIITRSRRSAIPMDSEVLFIELKEEAYGHGLAHLEKIDPMSLPPNKEARDIFKLMIDLSVDNKECTSKKLVYNLALFTKKQIQDGIDELLEHKAIVIGSLAQSYQLNKRRDYECNKDYLEALKK